MMVSVCVTVVDDALTSEKVCFASPSAADNMNILAPRVSVCSKKFTARLGQPFLDLLEAPDNQQAFDLVLHSWLFDAWGEGASATTLGLFNVI